MSAGPAEAATLTLRRRLTARQQARRSRMLAAATALASRGGYEAVVMKEVAARARVSLGTLYRYFASKDHLLAEALVTWGGELGRRLRESPPQGTTPAERVASVFRRMARGVEREPQLGIALTTALLSRDPSAFANREGLTGMLRDWTLQALGDAEVEDREGVIEVLQHVCFSCMIMLVNGQRTPREVGEALARCTRLLLGSSR
jgi:AcrR family transcriptional regulator